MRAAGPERRRAAGRGPTVVVQVVIDGARSERWRRATDAADHGLADWITDVVDRETAAVLAGVTAPGG